ncbi:MAG: hypothetical protein ALAOOOJD_02373 [bacterium]|nr:hypothetical protein [bacterium]
MPVSIAITDNRKTPNIPSRPLDAGLILLPLFLMGFLLARFAAPLVDLLPACTFRAVFGLPCPTCGATRAGLALARGAWLTALAHNPLFVIGLGVLSLWSLFSVIEKLRGKAMPFAIRSGQRFRGLTIGAILLNWLYLIFVSG